MGETCGIHWVKEGNTYRIVVERDQLEDLSLSRWITLKFLLQNRMAEHGLDELGSGWLQVMGCCEHGDQPTSCIKCGQYLDYPRNYWLLKKAVRYTVLLLKIQVSWKQHHVFNEHQQILTLQDSFTFQRSESTILSSPTSIIFLQEPL